MLKTNIKNLPQMETIAHQYLTKLRIIAKIPENGQLDLTNNDLNIYSPSLLNWINRKLQGDGKLNTVSYLRSFYREINGFTTEMMKSIEVEQNNVNKNRKTVLLASLAEKIKESTIGIENLIKTYRHYHKIVSTLESIQQDIIENQLKTVILFIPDKYKTGVLRDIENGQYDLIEKKTDENTSPISIPSRNSNENRNIHMGSPSSISAPITIPGSKASPTESVFATPHSFPQINDQPEEPAASDVNSNKKKKKKGK